MKNTCLEFVDPRTGTQAENAPTAPKLGPAPKIPAAKKVPDDLSGYVDFLHPWGSQSVGPGRFGNNAVRFLSPVSSRWGYKTCELDSEDKDVATEAWASYLNQIEIAAFTFSCRGATSGLTLLKLATDLVIKYSNTSQTSAVPVPIKLPRSSQMP